jgi:DNA replication protein
VRSVPVPSPLFGPLLEQIDDLDELKCTLRVIWLLQQKKGYPRFVTRSELLADRTLVTALATDGAPDHARVHRALEKAMSRGTLAASPVEQQDRREQLYALNTPSNKNALAKMAGDKAAAGSLPRAEPWEGATERPNIFSLYEANIGMLSPMIADQLREAEELYPQSWIEDAFQEAVSQNKRNWRYISRILERWDREGRSDGKPGRYIKKTGRY